jgi:hypothetical protein
LRLERWASERLRRPIRALVLSGFKQEPFKNGALKSYSNMTRWDDEVLQSSHTFNSPNFTSGKCFC